MKVLLPSMEATSLNERLAARGAEIEQAVLARAYSVSDPTADGDPEYVAGLKAAVSAAVGYGLSVIEEDGRLGSVPVELFVQARQAARNRVSLDTVLRRYFAGYTLLGEFVMQEAEDSALGAEEIHRLSKVQTALFEHLVTIVTDEYNHEARRRFRSSEHVRAERVKRLLAGELVEELELGYELSCWHLGAAASGPGAAQALRALAAGLDRRLLLVHPDGDTVWGWLGGRRQVEIEEVLRFAHVNKTANVTIAVGEPAQGLLGWRLSHRQALAALPVGLRSSRRVVRYADVALLASLLTDDVLGSSLREIYLAPLERERDGGRVLRRTLRAYFQTGRNVSSAAAKLRVTRQTVNRRLRAIEEHIGRPLDVCAAELEVALCARDLGGHLAVPAVTPSAPH
jgi:hypothetical protein